jgi:endonuclease/exonuclease/phosphatase family metal-dependent hydrolase
MNNRNWHVLCWNVRGINGVDKWDVVRDKIEESACSVFCLQETKKEHFDQQFVRNFAPRRYDYFDFVPSIGASGGILVGWNTSHFRGQVIDKQPYGITVSFTSAQNMDTWNLTTVYGPCIEPTRSTFVSWFKNHHIRDTDNWLFLGDFNFYRSLNNRNKPGGNLADTLIFNYAIGHLGLVELQLKGRAYTWSNMRNDPLLEQLDWFFTSVNWTLEYPNSKVLPMAKITSDHIPCKVSIGTNIPRSNLFRFENFWVEHSGFVDTVISQWNQLVHTTSMARSISVKFKKLRSALKIWSEGCLTCLC